MWYSERKVSVKNSILLIGIFFSFHFFSITSASEPVRENIKKTDTLSSPSLGEFSSSLDPSSLFIAHDSALSPSLIHKIGIEVRPDYIIPTHEFLRGNNATGNPIRRSVSYHLKYAFQFHPSSYNDLLYGGAYQGIGMSRYSFPETKQLGNPIAFYLFQGARINRFSSRLSLNYEWNFGLSLGWTPYNYDTNYENQVIGSKANAYINANFYLNWMLSRQLDVIAGVNLTHFSNGNTEIPNAGLNSTGLRVGLVYNINRRNEHLLRPVSKLYIPAFPRHMSYDLVLFGSWRRKGVTFGDVQVASPEAYTVLGLNLAAMYNLSYKLRLGLALDGVYDGSANVYTEDYIAGTEQPFFKPPLSQQLALGFSGRAEYVMPYFTVGLGLGVNVLHKGGDLNFFYQLLALKMELTRNSFLHIGYSIQNFHTPNYLMLGIGFRFHNKYPRLRH